MVALWEGAVSCERCTPVCGDIFYRPPQRPPLRSNTAKTTRFQGDLAHGIDYGEGTLCPLDGSGARFVKHREKTSGVTIGIQYSLEDQILSCRVFPGGELPSIGSEYSAGCHGLRYLLGFPGPLPYAPEPGH